MMKIVERIVTVLLAASVILLTVCVLLSRGKLPEGLFLLQNTGGTDITLEQKKMEKIISLYTELVFDQGPEAADTDLITAITADPYQTVMSYRRVEQAAEMLAPGQIKLYEAGLVPQSIAEKFRLALCGCFLYAISCLTRIAWNTLKSRWQDIKRVLQHMYLSEFLRQRWKWMLLTLAFPAGLIFTAVFGWNMVSFFPLKPIAEAGVADRIWMGVSGLRLLPEYNQLYNAEWQKLWVLNQLSLYALLVFGLLLIVLFFISFIFKGGRRRTSHENSHY